MDKTKSLQVKVNFDNMPDLFDDLDRMVADDMLDRSKFIKRLIRQERDRRRELARELAKVRRGTRTE